jgi:serine/threonine protein kinase
MYMSQPKILSSGVYGCVYYPGYICSGHVDTSNNVTKLVVNDFTTQTEIDVGKYLKNIEGFVVVSDSCNINHTTLQKSGLVPQCDLLKDGIKSTNQYKLLHSKNIKSLELDLYLNKYATSDIVIRTYLRMCKLIFIMIQKKIVHNDLHFGNILVENNKLYIIDYGLSIIMEKCYIGDNINYTYLKDVTFKYSPSWKYWTIEYHIICFLLHSKRVFTELTLNKLIDDYLIKHTIIQTIGNNFINNFMKTAKEYFNQYVGQSKDSIIKTMLQSFHTWDYYKIALNYINIYTTTKLINNDFLMILLLLIHPNPTFRPSPHELIQHNGVLIKRYKPEHVSEVKYPSKLIRGLRSTASTS